MKTKKTTTFEVEDFVDELWLTMKRQEKNDPHVALLHERLEGSICMIGLTGGIAAGKSTVSGMIKELGIPVIDADRIARDVVCPDQKAYRKIVRTFGRDILAPDKTLDRKKMGSVVFSDPGKKTLLESITHPEIFREIVKQVRRLKKKKTKTIVIDAALLFESGLHQVMHKTILIKTDPQIQISRLMARDLISEKEASQKITAQMPLEEKEKLADIVIDNNGELSLTLEQVKNAFTF